MLLTPSGLICRLNAGSRAAESVRCEHSHGAMPLKPYERLSPADVFVRRELTLRRSAGDPRGAQFNIGRARTQTRDYSSLER